MNETYYVVKVGRYYICDDFHDPQTNLISNMDSATRFKELIPAVKMALETNGQVIEVTHKIIENLELIKKQHDLNKESAIAHAQAILDKSK